MPSLKVFCFQGWLVGFSVLALGSGLLVGANIAAADSVQVQSYERESEAAECTSQPWETPWQADWGPISTWTPSWEQWPNNGAGGWTCTRTIVWAKSSPTPATPDDSTVPTGVIGVAGDGQVTVSWTAPVSDGGSPITSYEVTGNPGGSCTTAGALSCTVSGLTNGLTYSFTVTATNALGTSDASAPSAAVTPTATPTAPGPPTGVTGAAGDGEVSVSWAAPASDGGSAVTGYTVTSSPGSLTCATASTNCVVTGLTNGTAYTFTVTATNAVGTSAASNASSAVTPKAEQSITFTNPGTQVFGTTPTLTATASSGLSVSFASSTPAVCSTSVDGALTFISSGICTITANQAGDATFLSALPVTNSFTVSAVVPSAPSSVTGLARDGSVAVSWNAPVSNGGSPVTGYRVQVATSESGVYSNATGCSTTSTALSCTATGLTNGTNYYFKVAAINAAGTGTYSSASASVTPVVPTCTEPVGGADVPCAVGKIGPGGGLVFYRAGSAQSWGRYLEMAPKNWNGGASDPTMAWSGNTSGDLVGTSGALGAGARNTALMVAQSNTANRAGTASAAYGGGGYADWYLPSTDELNQMWLYSGSVSADYSFAAELYWTSTQVASTSARVRFFLNGEGFNQSKGTAARVRPIRAF
jgi:hypothetical protein